MHAHVHKTIHNSTFSMEFLVLYFQTFASLCAAFILRRHLMVWKIFAPAFIYEGASLIFVTVVCMITYVMFLRITKVVQKFISNLELPHTE